MRVEASQHCSSPDNHGHRMLQDTTLQMDGESSFKYSFYCKVGRVKSGFFTHYHYSTTWMTFKTLIIIIILIYT
ncbi:hypothetical protein ACHAXS_008898 [Conticribra weissflogii]